MLSAGLRAVMDMLDVDAVAKGHFSYRELEVQLAAAQSDGDPAAQVIALQGMGIRLRSLGIVVRTDRHGAIDPPVDPMESFTAAIGLLEDAVELAECDGHVVRTCFSLHQLGVSHLEAGQPERAVAYLSAASERYGARVGSSLRDAVQRDLDKAKSKLEEAPGAPE